MNYDLSVNLGNLLLSLSDAMDLVSPALAQHQQRTAFIVWEMGKTAKLPKTSIERLFLAALLHDIGALSPEEKLSLHAFEADSPAVHCVRGEALYNQVPWLKPSAAIVRHHHRNWQDWDEPITTPVVAESQILLLADYLERLIRRGVYILHQNEQLTAELAGLAGTVIHPEIFELFVATSSREDFWLDMMSPRLYSLLLHHGPYRRVDIDLSNISSLGQLFRNIIDFRSRFTSTHSSGVAECAATLARIFGFTETEAQLMEVAGNFHDIGKLAVPNAILEKPDKLTKEEFAIIKQHTYFTYSILSTIGGLQQIAEWAAFHHEKLDGSGYPFHVKADKIGTGARIMTVADIFTAIAEDRPYRKGMDKEGVARVLKEQADRNFLDKRIVKLLLENHDEIIARVLEKQAVTREYYERQFTVLTERTGDGRHQAAY